MVRMETVLQRITPGIHDEGYTDSTDGDQSDSYDASGDSGDVSYDDSGDYYDNSYDESEY